MCILTSLLPLIPGSVNFLMLVQVRVLSVSQIEMFENYLDRNTWNYIIVSKLV